MREMVTIEIEIEESLMEKLSIIEKELHITPEEAIQAAIYVYVIQERLKEMRLNNE